jgi:hypothetical protein
MEEAEPHQSYKPIDFTSFNHPGLQSTNEEQDVKEKMHQSRYDAHPSTLTLIPDPHREQCKDQSSHRNKFIITFLPTSQPCPEHMSVDHFRVEAYEWKRKGGV